MNIGSIIKNHKIVVGAFIIFLLAFLLRMWNLGAAGQVWDENSLLRDYAYHHINDVKNLDFGNDFWWKGTPDHPPLVRYMRGLVSILDIVGWDKNGLPIYSYDLFYDRMLSVLLTSFASVIVFLIGARYISLFTGVAGGMIFAMLPIVLGHSQIAMLEALALFFFPLSIFTYFLFLENPNNKMLTLAGVSLGFALLARETHLMLLPIVLIILFIKYKTMNNKFSWMVLYKTFGIFGISFLTFFSLWPMPFFHLDYFYRYTMDLRFSVHTSIPEVFFGILMLVPVPYYFVYFLITTPLLILFLMLIGLKKIDRSKKWIWYSLVVWLCFPFLMSFYHTRAQGIRYIIQITIPLALIAGLGLETILKIFTKKIIYKIIALCLLFIYQFLILWRITPYYIDYFNILVGGAKGVYERRLFHLAWWGEGLKEAFDYLKNNTPEGTIIGTATSPNHIFPYLPGKKVVEYENGKKYDYVVVNFYHIVRIGFDDSLVKRDYKVVYSVKADGAHLVEVYKRK